MRCFLGCELSPSAKISLDAWRDKALRIEGAFHAVKPANFHITTWFLGEVSAQQLDTLVEYIKANLTQANFSSAIPSPFILTLNDIVCWPQPKLVAAVPSFIPEQLSTLNQFCKRASSVANISATGNFDTFQPHVTLVRKVQPDRVTQPLFTPNIKFDVTHLHLFESVSGKLDVHYIPRFSFALPSQLSVREQLKQGIQP